MDQSKNVADIRANITAHGRMGDLNRAACYAPAELTSDQPLELAMPAPVERICDDAQPVLDSESIERFCRIWAEVGRAILARRSRS